MAYADLEIGLHRRDADGYRDTTAADGYADAKWGVERTAGNRTGYQSTRLR